MIQKIKNKKFELSSDCMKEFQDFVFFIQSSTIYFLNDSLYKLYLYIQYGFLEIQPFETYKTNIIYPCNVIQQYAATETGK